MFIYKITNNVNGNIYIGKTVKSITERFKKHIYNSRNGNTYLYKSMRKYGIENFSVTLLEEIKEEKLLDEREKFWIKELNPQYNLTEGGTGGNTTASINFWIGMERWRSNLDKSKIKPSRGMLGKKQSTKWKDAIKQKNSCPVMCEDKYFASVGDAEKEYPGISIRKRLDSPKYPEFYRLKPRILRNKES